MGGGVLMENVYGLDEKYPKMGIALNMCEG